MSYTAPNIAAGIELLNERLAPAVIKYSPANVAILFEWLQSAGLNPLHLTPRQIANTLEPKLRSKASAQRLEWIIAPKGLTSMLNADGTTRSGKFDTRNYADERATKAKEIEAAAAADKEALQQQAVIDHAVKSLAFTAAANGRTPYGKNERAQQALRNLEAHLKKNGTPLATVLKRVLACKENLLKADEYDRMSAGNSGSFTRLEDALKGLGV